MRAKTVFHAFVAPIIALILVGCSLGGDSSIYEVVEPGSISPGDAVPAPANDVVLTVSGDISVTNVDDTLAFDLDTLEKLKLVEYQVDDPWLKERVTYTGVLLSDLLEVAGAPDTVREVMALALDGYAAPIPVTELESWPVLVATQSNGEHMTIENSGPTRIIFPYDLHSDVTAARNMSVWNLETLEIR
ncbi:MAG: hypothetical protein AMJ56_08540 [Anaerolineae bacterium SG8_19]|jgi:hypothetical protein|nr:MAG: hypothetical protein AMJ56_08540 [Anaerolineae bacterium SG8_19]